ncbi:MAG: nuclear transport factor 2 family protein [Pseudomonadales bacterium]
MMVDVTNVSTRRNWLGLFGSVLAMLGVSGGVQAAAGESAGGPAKPAGGAAGQGADTLLAKEAIRELRHCYGMATDRIGTNTPEGIEEGRAIYHRIFTPDARIGAAGYDPVTGPDAWVDLVKGALAPYEVTQHFIGTQYFRELTLPDAAGRGGHARMASYLQAWHEEKDGRLYLFVGTYEDEAVFVPGTGWRIRDMLLHLTTVDYRRVSKTRV